MTARLVVYGLTDPRSGEIRYVGKSMNGTARVREHGQPRHLEREKTHKAHWIRGLIHLGLTYGHVILEECQSATLLIEAERRWITHGRAAGWNLTNLTDGGDGTSGRVLSQESRDRISEKLMGHHVSDAVRQSVAAARRGSKDSAETRAKKIASRTGMSLRFSLDSRRRSGQSRRGSTRPAAAVEKTATKLTGRPKGPAHREKLRESIREHYRRMRTQAG